MLKAKVVVVGAYGIGNVGDVALLETTVRMVTEVCSPSDVAVLTAELPYLRRRLPEVRFVDADDAGVIRARVLLYGGGTQFYAFRAGPGTNARIRRLSAALRSPPRAARAALRIVARRLSRFDSVALLGVGIGPFEEGGHAEAQTREVLRGSKFVAVRDRESLRLATGWSCPATLRSDLCFVDDPFARASTAVKHPDPQRPMSIAAIVRDWPHSAEGAAYAPALVAAAEQLQREGHRITFLSFCPPGDVEVLARLRERGQSVLAWDPDASGPIEFVESLATYDVVVSARYHGAVFAGQMGRPTICIEVEPKLALASEMLGTPELWRQPFAPDELMRLLGLVREASEALAARAQAAVGTQRALGRQMRDEFLSFLTAALT